MRNYYTFLLVAFSITLHSQTVNIPDPTFKTVLLEEGIDTDADGEIQVSEAEAVTILSLSHCELDNVIGIQAFTNLEHLDFGGYCDIANSVDLSGMSSLTYLNLTKSSMPSLNLSGLTNLETFSEGYMGNVELLNFTDSPNLKKMYFYNAYGADSLDLSVFPNLEIFSADGVSISSINTIGLSNLISFKYKTSGDGLAGLDLSDMTSLKTLSCMGANLTSIGFQNNILLEELTCTGNNFAAFNVSMLPNLKKLHCSSNHLATLDISNNPNLESLICTSNLLTSLDLSNQHKLQRIIVYGNLFTTLDFSGQTEIAFDTPTYEFYDNPNLVNVNMKNGRKDFFWMNNLNCPNLVYVCLDEIDMESQTNLMQQAGITNIQINTYCSFVPGGNYNTITGTLSFDLDNNGCDAADAKFADAKVTVSATDQNGITYSNSNGNYSFFTSAGEFLITPQLENQYFTVSPANVTVSFADGNNNLDTQNFCLTPIGIHNDVEITLVPLQVASPGFDVLYRLVYKNKGNQAASGIISLDYNDGVLDLVSANPAISSQNPNQLHWNYESLLPFETRTIDLTLNLNSPQETPPVSNGDILNFTASITPLENDETASDNTAVFAQTVLGSFDPNDKICLEGNTMSPEKIGDYLHYMIRFQNSGTFYAKNIVVKDIIDTEKLDIESLELTASSHPQVTRISGDKVEFVFENVNLPAEQDDESGSHGFIVFKIKTKNTLALGDSVENTADIFFDFNFPIATNTTSTTVTALGVNEMENDSVTMAPNPVKNVLNISAKDNISSIQLFDIQGRLLQTSLENHSDVVIDLSGKTSGVYFVKVTTDKGIKVQKIIKE